MEKETELYLIERIKDLETQLSFYKGFYDGTFDKGKPFRAEDFKETCTKDDLSQVLDNHFLKETGINPADLLAKAKAFDIIQEELQLAVGRWAFEDKYILYSHKLGFPTMFLTKEKFETLWGVLNVEKPTISSESKKCSR